MQSISDITSRLREVMAGYVERGEAPGLVMLVARGGEAQVDAIGAMSPGGEPMRRDTLFRITSMTKPVAAVAALILVEEGRLRLDETVDRLLPELADRRVLRRIDGPLDDTVPAARPITVRDLLTFRPGLGILLGLPAEAPIQRAIADLGILGFGPPDPAAPLGPDEWLRRLGTLPLMAQPGERWLYNTGSSVLGVLIERASGRPLEQLMRERVFEPLGMRDTGFSVPAEKLGRLPPAYIASPDGSLEVYDGVTDGKWATPPHFPDAAAGLVSTIDDYFSFGQMLLNGGRLGARRILSPDLVAEMTTNQITPGQKAGSEFLLGPSQGWGLGLAVNLGGDGPADVPNRFGWDGGYGTTWSSDPGNDLVGILMTQRAGYFELLSDFWKTLYQSLDD